MDIQQIQSTIGKREIKFMVADPQTGNVYYPFIKTLVAEDGTEYQFTAYNINSRAYSLYECLSAGMVPLQFTGLFDKNGKDIYDGDILVIRDQYPFFDYPPGVDKSVNEKLEGETIRNYIGTVEWIYAGWQIVLHCVNQNKAGISDGINEYLEEPEEYEVIGNIFENPDLLSA